jgi:hypothetical protein
LCFIFFKFLGVRPAFNEEIAETHETSIEADVDEILENHNQG